MIFVGNMMCWLQWVSGAIHANYCDIVLCIIFETNEAVFLRKVGEAVGLAAP